LVSGSGFSSGGVFRCCELLGELLGHTDFGRRGLGRLCAILDEETVAHEAVDNSFEVSDEKRVLADEELFVVFEATLEERAAHLSDMVEDFTHADALDLLSEVHLLLLNTVDVQDLLDSKDTTVGVRLLDTVTTRVLRFLYLLSRLWA